MAEHGMPPVVAAKPHFGRPEDAPARPPIFSGIQYRLPTAAVAELQPFQSLAAPGAWELYARDIRTPQVVIEPKTTLFRLLLVFK